MPEGTEADRLTWFWAVRYLSRYAASRSRLRQLLERKAARAGWEEDAAAAIDRTLDRLAELGLVDDAAYAGARARSLRARGRSSRRIAGELQRQGVGRDVAAGALGELGNEDAEVGAAYVTARKRRVGPWRTGPVDRARELAVLTRAGFSYGIARRVVDTEPEGSADPGDDAP